MKYSDTGTSTRNKLTHTLTCTGIHPYFYLWASVDACMCMCLRSARAGPTHASEFGVTAFWDVVRYPHCHQALCTCFCQCVDVYTTDSVWHDYSCACVWLSVHVCACIYIQTHRFTYNLFVCVWERQKKMCVSAREKVHIHIIWNSYVLTNCVYTHLTSTGLRGTRQARYTELCFQLLVGPFGHKFLHAKRWWRILWWQGNITKDFWQQYPNTRWQSFEKNLFSE